MSEKFCLKWNDFQSNVTKSFEAFRNDEHLHDVTLVSDDQNQATAHKIVLSASSEYFNNIFKKNKISNPFLCLEGLSLTDLNNILDYIYYGEIQIYQEDLDRFLSMAQRFKIKGLVGADEVKKEENSEMLPDNTFNSVDNPIQKIDTTDLTEIDEKLFENMEENSDRTWSCKICSKILPVRNNMKLHVETHVEGLSFPCNICGKIYRSRNVLRNHKAMKKLQ